MSYTASTSLQSAIVLLPFCWRVLSDHDDRFSYFAGVGVNSYITVELPFLPERERRCTRIAARSFCPEFDHHMEVSCDLLFLRSSGETCSLAEQLEEASAVFTVWNRDSRKGLYCFFYSSQLLIDINVNIMNNLLCHCVIFVSAVHTYNPKDVVLGTVKIPLAALLHKRTGTLLLRWMLGPIV